MSWEEDDEEGRTDEVLTPLAIARGAARSGFVPLMHALEQLVPGTRRIGGRALPQDEPVRFRHDPTFAFDHADVLGVEVERRRTSAGDRDVYLITTAFLGLSGTSSPLPSGMLNLQREASDEDASGVFFDLFHHRAVSVLYRVLVEGDLGRGADGGSDAWSSRLGALGGLDSEDPPPPGLTSRRVVAMLPFLAPMYRRTAWAMRGVLRVVLAELLQRGADVRIDPMLPTWADLELEDRSALGQRNARLASSRGEGVMILGSKMQTRASKVGIRVGPVQLEDYASLQPGGAGHERIQGALRLLGHEGLEYEVAVRIAPGQVPPLTLGQGVGQGLGRDTWLSGRVERYADVVFAVRLD